jgi:two-component system OmpR family response regulator
LALDRKAIEYSNILRARNLTMLTQRDRVAWHGQIVSFTAGEFRILRHLMHNCNCFVSAAELYDVVRRGYTLQSSKTVAVLVNRIRSKTARDVIITRRGFGYMVED